jgi:hypothetical protein
MTREQKRKLAQILLARAGDIAEFWGSMEHHGELQGEISAEEVSEQLGIWLRHLPGDDWDLRLKDPTA